MTLNVPGCCGCDCFECAKIQVTANAGTHVAITEAVAAAYSRPISMFKVRNGLTDPLALLADPLDCDDEYPGTECYFVAHGCCERSYGPGLPEVPPDTPPIDVTPATPIDTGSPTPIPLTPPPPEEGDDCFPVITCAVEPDGYGAIVGTSPATNGDLKNFTYHLFLDTDGRFWAAVLTYQYEAATETWLPHWVYILRADTTTTCEAITAAAEEGVEIVLNSFCDGLHINASEGECLLGADPIEIDGATITVYADRVSCCGALDICNPDPVNCEPTAPTQEEADCCDSCDSTITPRYLKLILEGFPDIPSTPPGYGTCGETPNYSRLDGTYYIELFQPCSPFDVWGQCVWRGSHVFNQGICKDTRPGYPGGRIANCFNFGIIFYSEFPGPYGALQLVITPTWGSDCVRVAFPGTMHFQVTEVSTDCMSWNMLELPYSGGAIGTAYHFDSATAYITSDF